ncbi:ParB/Srx family N-terminal domain-containing protein [Crenobacter cavernae]|uniref:Chromosome partitioning protein ParB n=1 Tax=Crenobacter cavernae TaxID=2290923 RepID=A0A345Y484_9NEIS|nr:ParB/Srx family N-terminal domain-containing protein [Crenobacter cavernae]AXK38736.1 chromosome partitioning protein ParB [Crenobacter cavernae]
MAAFFCVFFLAGTAAAEPVCSAKLEVGTRCVATLASLRPTQPAVGLMRVEDEAASLAGLSPDALEKRLKKRRVPLVAGPDGALYLVDRHHQSRALLRLGQREVPARLVGRLDKATTFWNDMQARHWAWLRDAAGRPLPPEKLPATLAELPDDPWRSLAGYAEDAGFVGKSGDGYFAEFVWAEWLVTRLPAPPTRDSLDDDLATVKRLICVVPTAKLPGEPGRACAKR